jgi:hypothetical protein
LGHQGIDCCGYSLKGGFGLAIRDHGLSQLAQYLAGCVHPSDGHLCAADIHSDHRTLPIRVFCHGVFSFAESRKIMT